MSVDAQSNSPPEEAPKEKTDMEKLNEETLKQQGAVDEKVFKGVKIMRDVFSGYKIGKENEFLEPPESDKTEDAINATEKTVEVSEVSQENLEAADKKFDSWGDGNGIAGAALSLIKIMKDTKDLLDKKDPEDGEEEFVNSIYGAKFETAGAIIDAYEKVEPILRLIPGIDFVFDAIAACTSVYKIMKADKARVRMNNSRRLFKQKYLDKKVSMPKGKEKSMVRETQGLERLKFWKKTNITVDEETLKARRDQLLAARDKEGFTEEEAEELRDILKYLVQDKLRVKNRNDEMKSIGSFIKSIAAITGKIAALVTTGGASAVIGGIGTGVSVAMGINTAAEFVDKKRNGKKRGTQYTNYLLEVIASLPNQYQEPKDKSEYVQASEMVDASGVDGTKVYKTAQVAQKASSDADKNAGKAKAYQMFVDLFEG